MDKTDSTIINVLTEDARTSFRKIARKLGMSADAVISRYERLLQDRIIRGSTVILDPSRIGYEGMAAFHIDVASTGRTGADSASILKTIIKIPNVIVATKTIGDHDLLALSVIHNFEHLMKLGQEIASIPGVKNIQTSLWSGSTEICYRYFMI